MLQKNVVGCVLQVDLKILPVERHKEIRYTALILTGKEQGTIAIYFNLKKVEAER
jgi:hypothetical protein